MIKLDGYRKFAAGLALIAALTGCSTKVPNDPTKTTEPTQEVTPTMPEKIVIDEQELVDNITTLRDAINEVSDHKMTSEDILATYTVYNYDILKESGFIAGADYYEPGFDLAKLYRGGKENAGETNEIITGFQNILSDIYYKFMIGEYEYQHLPLELLFENKEDKDQILDFLRTLEDCKIKESYDELYQKYTDCLENADLNPSISDLELEILFGVGSGIGEKDIYFDIMTEELEDLEFQHRHNVNNNFNALAEIINNPVEENKASYGSVLNKLNEKNIVK